MGKTVRFDRHARRRMKWRKITEKEVKLTLNSPDKTEKSIKGRTNVFRTIGAKYIKVTYKEFSDKIRVISVVDKS